MSGNCHTCHYTSNNWDEFYSKYQCRNCYKKYYREYMNVRNHEKGGYKYKCVWHRIMEQNLPIGLIM